MSRVSSSGDRRAGAARLLAAGGLLLVAGVAVSGCFLFDPCAGANPGPECEMGDLMITEVSACPYTHVACWFELYNRGGGDAELSNYTFRADGRINSGSYDSVGQSVFTLPGLTVPPGSYAVVRAEFPWLDSADAGLLIHVSNGGVAPNWVGSSGFLELLQDSATADFVAWGGSAESPASPSHWDGGVAPSLPFAGGNDDFGRSIALDGSNTDTDSGSDWFFRDFATPGGPNDVTSNVDADLDGIPDSSESPGGTFAGLPLYSWGARTGQPDIFVHVDYMNSSDPGVTPQCEALDQVVAAFAAAGFQLHFDAGDLCDPAAGNAPPNHDLDDASHQVPFVAGVALGDTGGTHANLYEYKNSYMSLARKQVFHYLMFANSQNQNGSSGSSGIAELFGNDLIVSLGGWLLDATPGPALNKLINYQAGTLMHELGHNLGLRHGGDEDRSYMPNYLSVMNYLYQLDGVATIGNMEGDRYMLQVHGQGSQATLIGGPTGSPGAFGLDFSDGSGGDLDETSVNETNGLQRGAGPVDYDFSLGTNDGNTYSLNPDYDGTSSDLHTDYDDWGSLALFFTRTLSGHAEGFGPAQLVSSPVGDDRQPVYPETPFPDRFYPTQ